MHEGQVVGSVTSGAWGHRAGITLAYGFVSPALTQPATAFELGMCGEMIPVRVIDTLPLRPRNAPAARLGDRRGAHSGKRHLCPRPSSSVQLGSVTAQVACAHGQRG
ncbi:glycine cleavage T C-terminal barrel domain-containing protein [Roseovarius atlanticus]|uniref:glycine cleavage T C-terminal barrel domain-containing protein n=1 Tax=Roseovarius atlanticus TaxID=1641875 RepID=UPI001C9807E3|nr:glycine cleavage T C-terminal barrel domain-containing protein [Roseovarius atlanticus]MBY5987692.1 hypothetical protein [Roseovarius atlanticus]MBY6123083.1 hypothetical protein [Roseovarius atlanticus]MBY6147579.1 hypothetical protein [Roseovarius atlanticus]